MYLRKQTFMSTLESLHKKYPPAVTGMISLESIAFQKNDLFGSQLEAVIQKYKDLIDAGVKQSTINKDKELKKQLERIIFARLGIKVSLHINSHLAATMPNVYVPHNPMVNSDIRWIYEILDKESGQGKLRRQKPLTNLGTVNTETVKVTGWFSEQEVPVYMNFWQLFKDFEMTVSEVAAVLLHELGHDFNGILFCANVNTTNQIIADIIKHISDKERGGDVKYIYAKIKQIYPKASADIADALASGDKIVMNVAAYRLMVGVTESLLSESSYDRNGFEALADNFAARFGYSLALITGLEKLEKLFPEYARLKETSEAQIFIVAFSSLLGIALGFAGIATGIAGMLIAAIGFLFVYLAVMVFNSGTISGQDMTYDKIKDRYTRIRLQMVEFIKDPDLEAKTKETILDQIKLVDGIINEKLVFVGFIERLSKSAFPKDRRAFASIETQQEIEKMIANDIFVSANRLALKA